MQRVRLSVLGSVLTVLALQALVVFQAFSYRALRKDRDAWRENATAWQDLAIPTFDRKARELGMSNIFWTVLAMRDGQVMFANLKTNQNDPTELMLDFIKPYSLELHEGPAIVLPRHTRDFSL